MEVIRAEVLGSCTGVRRALRIVDEALAAHPGTPVFTLGPLVHNPQVVEELRRRGVVPVDDPTSVERGIVVIRSHGVGPEVLRGLDRPGIRCIDATCANVRRVHRLVAEHHGPVVIVGDPVHPEVEGIAAHAPQASVVGTLADAQTVPLPEGTLVVCQTTFPQDEYRRIAERLRVRQPSVRVADTGCPATEQRQDSLRTLAARVQALVVVGGRQSANTARLYRTAVETGLPSWLVETAAELPSALGRFATVGLTAGASTPDATIDDVERRLRAIPAV